MSADRDAAHRVKQQLVARLHGDPHLRGIGLAPVRGPRGGYSVVVRVARAAHVSELDLPASMDGIPIVVTVIGDVVARQDDPS